MTYDKNLWQSSIDWLPKGKLPAWPCPTCQNGVLGLDAKSLKIKEIKQSAAFKNYYPEASKETSKALNLLAFVMNVATNFSENTSWKQARFNAFLKCSDEKCSDIVTVCGSARIPVQRENNVYALSLGECLKPEYFSPALPIIKICANCPNEVKDELTCSFALFFTDPSSSGNRIRASLELLLDSIGISRNCLDDKGTPHKTFNGMEKRRGLHDRIEDFSKKYNHLGGMLLAIKMLGNEASHGKDVTQADLLEVYGIIDYLLEELYIRPGKHENALRISSDIKDKYSK